MQTKFDVGQTVYIPFKIIKISATKTSMEKDNIEYKVKSLHSLSSPYYIDIVEQDILKWKEEIDNEIIVQWEKGQMDDLIIINKQAAIDALCSVCGVDCDKSKFVYGGKQEDQVIFCPEHYVLTQLPSAQPEIIRCKDCRYSEYDSIFHSRYCHNKGKAEIVGDNFFCAAGRYMTNGSD